MHLFKFSTAVAILLFSLSTQVIAASKTIAENADSVQPLLNGQTIPNVIVTQQDGEKSSLHNLLKGKKTVLFFYRGGWCPFCNTQMGQLKAIEQQLIDLDFQLIGVSTDSVADLNESIKDKALTYQLLSDYSSKVSQAFGLAFFSSEETTKRYLAMMDLQNPLQKNAQGQERLVLPVPAIYVIDKEGLVQFNYVNPNFKVRLDEQLLLLSAKLVK